MANQRTKWYILGLIVVTNIILLAMPSMGMSVLSKEISQDLNLNLVQVGVVWGIGSFPSIITSILGGVVGDKFGPKRVLVTCLLLAGLLGASRGFAMNFASMTMIVILYGAITPFITMNEFKAIGQWFSGHQLGFAYGLFSLGMALGFLLGSLLSATTFSPLLGGWRNVLIAYGIAGAALSIPWLFTPTIPLVHPANQQNRSMRQMLRYVIGLKNIWLLGLTLFGIGGAIQGLLGYLPLYLRGLGWETIRADGTLSAFHMISMIFTMPISLWSDRLGSRKRLLFLTALMVTLGIGLLSIVNGNLIWAAVLMAGFVRDAFMAIFTTMVIETDGIGATYAGTSTGFTNSLANIGYVVAPPIGNSLAGLAPNAPFVFWAGLAACGMVCLSLITKKQKGALGTGCVLY